MKTKFGYKREKITWLIMRFLLIIIGYFGLDWHFKLDISEKKSLLKEEMIKICSVDNKCLKSVEVHFQECFDNNFDEDALGHYTKFHPYEFSSCMNEGAEANFFKPIWLSNL